MIHFKFAEHNKKENTQVVEVWDGKIFIAAIYPADPGSIRIISKYSHEVTESNDMEVIIDWAGGGSFIP